MEEACKALSGKQQVNDDSEAQVPLVSGDSGGSVVTYLGLDPTSVPAEPVVDFAAASREQETSAMPAPVKMEIAVPTSNWDRSKPFVAHGPSGPINVHLPQDAVPGSKLICKLAPKPEYRIRVPPEARPGGTIRIPKKNGEEIDVVVPPGLQPGDTFDVFPPAVMVRVPDNAKPGDYVVFRKEGSGSKKELFRARIPEGCQPWDHFSAILPPPGRPE